MRDGSHSQRTGAAAMSDFWTASVSSLPLELKSGLWPLVQAVYRQQERMLRAPYLNHYYCMVEVSYRPAHPPAVFINIAEGWEEHPGGTMVCTLTYVSLRGVYCKALVCHG